MGMAKPSKQSRPQKMKPISWMKKLILFLLFVLWAWPSRQNNHALKK
jgi:hypothetical protein